MESASNGRRRDALVMIDGVAGQSTPRQAEVKLDETDYFMDWLEELKDATARCRINARIFFSEAGDFGDCGAAGSGISEMRIHYGPGYRLYYCQTGADSFLLLCGGTKGTQRRDIERAKTIKRESEVGSGHGDSKQMERPRAPR